MSPVRDGLCPGVPGHSQAACRGSGPPGRAGLRAHSSREEGGWGGQPREEKQTRSVCRRHKARFTKGGREGRRGLPGAPLIPTPARGFWEECALRIPRLWPAREIFSTSGLGEGLSRQALGGQDKQRLLLRKELDLGGCTVAQPSRAHPSPGATFCAFPGCGSRCPQLWSRHPTGGSQQSRPSEIFRWLQEGLTFPQRLAGLQLSSSRLQGHFSLPEVHWVGFGGHAW